MNSHPPRRRRFIAGAKCSQCGETDKTCLFTESGRDWIECVSCGYSEYRPDKVEAPAAEVPAAAGAVKWTGQPEEK